MGWVEIVNILGSGAFAGFMTIWATKMENQKLEREFLIKKATHNEKSSRAARNAKGGALTETNQDKKTAREIKVFGKVLWASKYSIVDNGKAIRSTGFHATRRFLAVMVLLSTIFLPKVLPIFTDVTMIIGYYESFSSILPWVSDVNKIKWVAFGSGSNPITITPMEINLVYSIAGMFFGNQITKK